jgi:adenylate cyclase
MADVFALQDEIVDAIVGALQPALLSLEGLRAARREPASLDAWECAHRGVHHGYRRTPDELAEARRWFERSAASDPHFAPAFWGLAATLLGQFAYAGVEAAKTLPPALQHARRAVELDAADPMSHLILAGALWLTGQAGPSLSALERAVELNPSSAYAHWGLGMSLRTPERADEAVAGFEKAIRLSPQDPMRGEFLAFLASTHLLRGRDEDALEAARKAVACRPDLTLGHGVIAAAHALLGHRAEAEAAVAEVLRREPDPAHSLRLIRAFHPPALVERYVDGLRKAGWPG